MGEAFISRRRHIGIAVEATKGTAETLITADYAIEAYDIQVTTQFGRFDRDNMKSYLSKLPGIVGTKACQITFTCPVRHTANATTLDVWERALQGCGFKLATSTLSPTSNGDDQVTLTIEVCIGAFGSGSSEAVVFKAKGCVGNVQFEGKVGQPLLAKFTFMGVYNGVVDSTIEVPTAETGIPGIFQGVSFTWGGTARICSTISLDLGNQLVMRESVNATAGLLHGVITDRRPTGSIDPDLELVATEDFYGAMNSNTSKALSFAVATGGSSRTQTFAASDCRITNVSDSNRNGIQTAGLSFELVDTSDSSTPDQDLTITLS
jgi:hypothetical protein